MKIVDGDYKKREAREVSRKDVDYVSNEFQAAKNRRGIHEGCEQRVYAANPERHR